MFSAKKAAAASAKTKIGKAGPIVEKITFPAEKDVNKLVNYVCGSNIYTEGEDIKVCRGCFKQTFRFFFSHIHKFIQTYSFVFQLKPESEYPDWLWNIHVGPPLKLEEMDPNTKAYWRRVRKNACRQYNRLQLTKRRHLY